eukprot:8689-Heterococcus_DN1.PRE.2
MSIELPSERESVLCVHSAQLQCLHAHLINYHAARTCAAVAAAVVLVAAVAVAAVQVAFGNS